MTSTVYVDNVGPVIAASWLNDVDKTVYASRAKLVYATEVGADPTGTVDATSLLQTAIATGKRLVLNGTFKISSPLEPTQSGIIGLGSDISGLLCNSCHGVQILSTAAFDRPAVLLAGFSVNSSGNTCDSKYAFYIPGVTGGAAALYNSGITIKDIEIGRTGRMGGGFYIKDVFRLAVQDVGLTDVSWMIRVVGSVVQAKFRNVTSNNDSAAATLSLYGISTESATYASGTLTPENVRFIDCSYIRGARGVDHRAGLDIEFVNLDSETTAYGMILNAPCNVTGGVVAPSSTATVWVGVSRGVSPSNPDDGTFIDDLDINFLNQPGTPASSYGVDIGDGVSPVYGVTLSHLRIRGVAGSCADAIRSRDARDLTVEDCFIRNTVVTGTAMNLGGRQVWANRNRASGGTILFSDAGEPTAGGTFTGNDCTTLTLTLTTPANWTLANPKVATSNTRLVGESVSTFTGTLTGCTTSPTGSVRYAVHGKIVTLFIPSVTATSNTAAATLTGMPSAIFPARTQDMLGRGTDNGANGICGYRVNTTGVIDMFFGSTLAGWTAAGVKGTNNCTITYSLD